MDRNTAILMIAITVLLALGVLGLFLAVVIEGWNDDEEGRE